MTISKLFILYIYFYLSILLYFFSKLWIDCNINYIKYIIYLCLSINKFKTY